MNRLTESVEGKAAGPRPTAKQLKYLRVLARRTGGSFTPPSTIAEASAEIERLKGRPATNRKDRYWEERAVRDKVAGGSPVASEGDRLN